MRTRIRKTLVNAVKELRKRNDHALARSVQRVVHALWRPPTPEIAAKRKKQLKEINKALLGFGMKKDLVRHGTKYETEEMLPKDMGDFNTKMAKWWKQLSSKHGFRVSKGHSGAKYFVQNAETNVNMALYVHTNRKEGTVRESIVVDI